MNLRISAIERVYPNVSEITYLHIHIRIYIYQKLLLKLLDIFGNPPKIYMILNIHVLIRDI